MPAAASSVPAPPAAGCREPSVTPHAGPAGMRARRWAAVLVAVALAGPVALRAQPTVPGVVAADAAPAAVPAATSAASAASATSARDASRSAGLLPFASEEGLARLARSTARADFAALANQFEPQSNGLFCGPTTAAIVLNALQAGRRDLPRDPRRFQPGDTRHLPVGFDATLPRHTQDSVIARGPKTRAQVFGEPVPQADGAPGQPDFGYQLRQFDALLRAHGVATRVVVVGEAMPADAVRADLVANLRRPGDFAVVNYRRDAVGQRGGGHISPLGAYDAASDSFLVLDVNPSAAGWVWMPATTLIQGMRTRDVSENRGYVLVGLLPD